MWELRVYDLNAQLIASYNPSSPGGIVGPFRWAQYSTGGTIRLQFGAIPSLSNLPPRSIVHLYLNGEPVAGGVLLRVWPSWDGHVRTYEVASPRYLMETRFSFSPISEVSLLEYLNYLKSSANPLIDWPQPATLPQVNVVGRNPYKTPISHLLSDVLYSVGMRWDVVPIAPTNGKLFRLILMYNTPRVTSVPYEDGAIEASPADFTNIPDGAWVIIPNLARLYEGIKPTSDNPQHFYVELTNSGAGAIHSAIVLANPAIQYVECYVVNANAWSYPERAVDGDLYTYTTQSSTINLLQLQYGPGPYYPIGYRVYIDTPPGVTWIQWENVTASSLGWVRGFNPALFASSGNYGAFIEISTTGRPDTVKIYEVQGIVIQKAYVESILQTLYAPLYYPDSGTLTFRKYVPPADIITITNGPYGDLAGALESAEYEISVEGGVRTRFQLGRSHDLTRELISRESTTLTAINRMTGGRL